MWHHIIFIHLFKFIYYHIILSYIFTSFYYYIISYLTLKYSHHTLSITNPYYYPFFIFNILNTNLIPSNFHSSITFFFFSFLYTFHYPREYLFIHYIKIIMHCGLCLQKYTTFNPPRLIPICGHTFCQNCLNHKINSCT